jgi:hypothetical protein
MSTNLVVVAIPDENDRVWRISSEKVPHMTLLFLGDSDNVDNLDSIMQFVEHAADRSLNRFYLPVDRRGELGADKADVLFFKKGRYDFRAVRDFRHLLLQNDNIKTAYDSTSQFEFPDHVGAAGQEWIPHLTLGYPDTPAKSIPDDQMTQIYDVQFDRIAVWMGNYDGPEFQLKDYWDEMDNIDMQDSPALSMASANEARKAMGLDASLEHFGVKGMRWGVRNDTQVSVNGTTKMVSAKKAEKMDKAWEKRIYSLPGAIDVHNAQASYFNERIGAINDKHDVTFTDAHWADSSRQSWSPAQKAYMAEVDKVTLDGTRKAVEQVHGKSPTGKLQARLGGENGDRIIVKRIPDESEGTAGSPGSGTSIFGRKARHDAMEHADGNQDDEVLTVLALIRNADGLITKAEPLKIEESMSQTEDLGAEFLEHYGVKGMRWGVRNEPGTAGGAKDVAKKIGGGVKKGVGGAVKLAGDISFENQALDGRAREQISNMAHKEFKATDLPAIKAKPEHQQAAKLKNRLRHPLDPGTRAYRKDVRETYIKRLETTANSLTNFSGDRQFTIRERGIELPSQGGDLPSSKYFWEVSTRPVQHSDIEAELVHAKSEHFEFVELVMDDDGWITDIRPAKEEDLAQTAGRGEEFLAHLGAKKIDLTSISLASILDEEELEHHGVKGMRWGVRNDSSGASGSTAGRSKGPPVAVAPTAVSKVPHGDKRKTRIKTEGGQNHPASDDAIRVAQAHAKLKKSGTAALSNKELQDVQNRLNLERNVQQLVTSRTTIGRGRAFVKSLTGLGKDINEPINTGLQTAKLVKQLS